MSDGEQDERRLAVEMFELAVIDLGAVNSRANITYQEEWGRFGFQAYQARCKYWVWRIEQ